MAADNEQLGSIKLNVAAQSLTQKHTHRKVINSKEDFDPHRSNPTQWMFFKEILILGFF